MRTGVLAVLMVLGMAACGEQPADVAQPTGGGTRAAAAGGDPAADAVAAVLQSKGPPVARLQFLLGARPTAGTAFAVQLLVSAATPMPALQLNAESAAMTVTPTSTTLTLPTADEVVSHELTVTAADPGLTELTVRLKSDAAAVETVYVIPVLVAGPDDPAPAPAAAPAAPAP